MPNSVLIQLKSINYQINKKCILEDISFTIHKGEMVTVIGPNGAGKSTLIKLIIGLLSPTSGKIIKNNQLKIGYVPQKLKFEEDIPLTVKRFLALNNKKQNSSDINNLLSKVEASHLLNSNMFELSGGEMQKILFAHALMKEPQLLILDEPAQGLDIKSQGMLYDLITETKNKLNCGVLLISHDLHLVTKNSDNVICLNQKICCMGTPKSLENEHTITELFGTNIFNQLSFYQHTHNHDNSCDAR